MRKIYILTLLFYCLPFFCLGQKVYTLADTAYANQLMRESVTLSNLWQLDSAMSKVDSAQIIFEQALGKEEKKIIDVLNLKTSIFQKQKNLGKAFITAQQVLNLNIKHYGVDHLEVAQAYYMLGKITNNPLKKDSANIYYQKALSIYLKIFGEIHPRVAQIYGSIGWDYHTGGSHDLALWYYQKAIEIYSKSEGDNDLMIAKIYERCSFVLLLQGKMELSLTNAENNLKICLKKFGNENNIAILKSYSYIAFIYKKMHDFEKSLYYSNKCLEVTKKYFNHNASELGLSYFSIGSAYQIIGEYNGAIDLFYLALEANPESKRSCFRALAETFFLKEDNDMALFFLQKVWELDDKSPGVGWAFAQNYIIKGENDKALKYAQESLEWTKNIGNSNSTWQVESYEVLGYCYQGINAFEKAIDAFQQSLKIYEEKLNSRYSYKVDIYSAIAECYEKLNNYDSAYYYYQKAIVLVTGLTDKKYSTNSLLFNGLAKVTEKQRKFIEAKAIYDKTLTEQGFEYNKGLKKGTSVEGIVNTLKAKAAFECHWFLETHDKSHLTESANTYQQVFIALNYQNQLFHTEGAKTDQKKRYYTLYENAIETNLLLNTSENLENSFSINEKYKASLLQNKLKENNALHFANIPDTLLKREKNLRLTITAIEKGRQERLNEGKSEIDSSILVLITRADSLRTLYADLKKQFEKDYPDYYRLKYDYSTIPLSTVQQNMLTNEQTLLSYFVGDSTIYAFVVRKDTFAVFNFKKDFPLELWVKQLRNGLYGYHTAEVKTEKLYDRLADSFAIASYQLNQKLITPLNHLLTKEVVIVPDGVLNYVPFDVLLSEKPADASKFNKHKYLGKNHILSYNYSATLWQEMRNKRHHKPPTKNFIGFAPYYNGDTTLLSNLFSHDMTMRKGLDSLQYSGEEVFKAKKMMQGDALFKDKATKANFKKMVGDYRIVHLATHGKANDKVGDYCFLAFNEQKDSIDNELLYARDIYNISLNADLVVLSACETGIGELKRGEGVVSLARAFAYAGAKSMVTTLWSVNDKSTMQIMEGFYRNLKKGLSKDKALWQSKLDYLGKSKSDTGHPFYWSAFIPIGDMSAIKN